MTLIVKLLITQFSQACVSSFDIERVSCIMSLMHIDHAMLRLEVRAAPRLRNSLALVSRWYERETLVSIAVCMRVDTT